MPTSYRNIIDGNELTNAITTGDFSKAIKPEKTAAKYIKGYADKTAIETLANSLNINKGIFNQFFGLENKQLDAYDPYHTQDAKREEFWYDSTDNKKLDGKTILNQVDENTSTFKNALYKEYNYRQSDFWYEDPLIPSFEISFDTTSPFFTGNENEVERNVDSNSLKSFLQKYTEIDPDGYSSRLTLWNEFKNVFFKIFEKDIKGEESRNPINKPYYITKLSGLEFLNKKIIKYGEDKITITLNEDISMAIWYIAELYNNIAYSYRNQRYMFPENVLRFDMTIKINDMRNFVIPESANQSSPTNPLLNRNDIQGNEKIKNILSKKSRIVYTLHDCNFNFFESKNYNNEIEMGGFGVGSNITPSTVSFDIFFKSVTRWSEFPLQEGMPINPWEKYLYNESYKQTYYGDLSIIKSTAPADKGYLNQLLTKSTQNVVNLGLNYTDNLETSLREVRGGVVNDLLKQFRNLTNINKIEPDNIYGPNFNSATNFAIFGKQVGASLLNDMETATRNATNF